MANKLNIPYDWKISLSNLHLYSDVENVVSNSELKLMSCGRLYSSKVHNLGNSCKLVPTCPSSIISNSLSYVIICCITLQHRIFISSSWERPLAAESKRRNFNSKQYSYLEFLSYQKFLLELGRYFLQVIQPLKNQWLQ